MTDRSNVEQLQKNRGKAMTLNFSEHALVRVRQRGLREDDVRAIMETGTAVDDDSLFLLGRDVDREVRRRKAEIATLERLRGCRVVVAGETVVTVYRPSRDTEKKILHGYHRRPGAGVRTGTISTENGVP